MKIFKIVMLSLIAAVLIFVLVTGGSIITDNIIPLFNINANTQTAEPSVQILDTSCEGEDVEIIKIYLVDENLELHRSADNNFYISQYGSDSERAVDVSLYEGTLEITSSYKTFDFVPAGDVQISVPKDYNGVIVIYTVSGEMFVTDMQAEIMHIQSTSGNLYMSDVSVNKDLDIISVSGSIEIVNTVCESSLIEITSGDVYMQQISLKDIEVDSDSSDLYLDLADIPEKIEVSSISGDTDILLPEDSAADIDFNSTSGDSIINGILVEENSDLKIKVDSVSGDMTVNTSASE